MRTLLLLIWASLALLIGLAATHPGEDPIKEAAERRAFLASTPHLQKRCAAHLEARGHTKRSVDRRRSFFEEARKARGIVSDARRNEITSVLATDHNRTLGYPNATSVTDPDSFFTDSSSCILMPEVPLAEGPYYVEGELVRYSGVEDLIGITMLMDVQFIDIETCEPVPNQYVEFWEANQTGVYSGTVGNGNGNPNDLPNLNNTFLRAIQPTDGNGVVQVELLFPGHYAPRATHTHFVVHQNATLLPNNTLTYSDISHVGQIFFDQDLIYEADTVYPYTLNQNAILPNADDNTLIDEAATTDPVANYLYLGDEVSDGILAWITVGINTTYQYTLQPAAWWTADGGVENPVEPSTHNDG
ncbi:intradiol ring-cleavage dioxygenase [Aspergillus fischeri NRRL 181]|uniref:Dioxygenase, putative n=1 Tax=Neosartorya fischeri (strain ATCC 1020 / DSM 3700 / CBS 544.65 / FGSC A1164 / JCM 1740 / NRRL 181 / WB 181) TaxID=331117 RepID=A1CY42_NEOFI|nr:dioxygenase, putative [Aspergillus fischeri NRRL 181]EAW23662.1 dioxygenase, putative [Aspergillus fischeri NRRL 181]